METIHLRGSVFLILIFTRVMGPSVAAVVAPVFRGQRKLRAATGARLIKSGLTPLTALANSLQVGGCRMNVTERCLARRGRLKILGVASSGIATTRCLGPHETMAQEQARGKAIETFTEPGANPHWNSVGPYVTEPQKVPLILLTDRPVQLETPRHYFRTAFTPNEAFYVRWHLEGIPNAVDLKNWKLQIEGNVNKPLALSLA